MGMEHLTVLFPTEVSSFDLKLKTQVEQHSGNFMRNLCVSSVFTVKRE